MGPDKDSDHNRPPPHCQHPCTKLYSKPFPSAPLERLRTRDVPGEVEARDIARMLPDARHHLKNLQALTRDLETYVEGYECLISPMRKLPPEVLEAVFSFCCEPEELGCIENEARNLYSSTSSMIRQIMQSLDALSLSQVCHLWREIALKMPNLWTDISVFIRDNDMYTEEDLELCQSIVEIYLSRSKDCPLSVRLWFPLGTDIGSTDPIEAYHSRYQKHRDIVSILVQHTDRWRQLYLGMCLFNINTLTRERPFSNLETLALQCHDGIDYVGPQGRSWNEDIEFPFTKDVPKLQTLLISGRPIPDECLQPLPRVSRLEIFEYPPEELIPILAWAPEDCDIEIRNIRHEAIMDPAATRVNCNARSLTLHSQLPATFRDIFESLDLTRIKELRLDASLWFETFPFMEFQDLIRRMPRKENLETLELLEMHLGAEELASVLVKLPNLTTLTLSETLPEEEYVRKFTKDLLFLLHPQTRDDHFKGEPMVPKLKHLTFAFNSESELDAEEMLKMVESRCTSFHSRHGQVYTCLASFRLQLRATKPLSLDWVQRMCSLGDKSDGRLAILIEYRMNI